MNQPSTTPRWYRRYLQFSLRTLLFATTLSAVGCWWFLRPASREELIGGNYLQLRRQVRVLGPEEVKKLVLDPFADHYVNVGAWRIRDLEGRLLVDGRYADDQPHGSWVLYHPSGHKAAAGEMQHGLRTGLWRTWDAGGTLRSEVTYRIVKLPAPRPRSYPARRPLVTGPTPAVGMTTPLMQFGASTNWPTYYPVVRVVEYVCERHGPARGWYANGQPQFTGSYEADRRAGLWTYYDEQGRVSEKGAYQDDRREGIWIIRDAATGHDSAVEYVADRTAEQHERWLAARRKDLATGSLARQMAAIGQLAMLGERGRSIVAELLAAPRDEVKLLALRTLLDREALTENMLPQIEPLVEHADERLALRARLAVYWLSPNRRAALFEPTLQAALASTSELLVRDTLHWLYAIDPPRRRAVAEGLIRDHVRRGRRNPGEPRLEGQRFGDWGYFDRVEAVAALARIDESELWNALDACFASRDADVRVFVGMVVRQVVQSQPGETVSLPDGSSYLKFTVPPELQPLVERAKIDPDEDVRNAAALVEEDNARLLEPPGGFF